MGLSPMKHFENIIEDSFLSLCVKFRSFLELIHDGNETIIQM